MILKFGIILTVIGALIISTVTIPGILSANRDDKPHKGSMGQCLKINRELDLGGSKEDCRDSFTGKGHNDPDPLP